MNERPTLGGDQWAALLAGIVFLIGLGLLAIVHGMHLGDTATLIALLVVPLLVYAIASGRLQEFSAPGGWGAKFKEVARQKVEPTPVTDCIQNLQIVQKGGIDALKSAGQKLERTKPIALTLRLGRQNYDAHTLRLYLETLQIADPELTILFLDSNSRFVAMIEGVTLLRILNKESDSHKFLQALREANTDDLRSIHGIYLQSIIRQKSNAEALQLMRETNAKALVVVDDEHHPTGIVKRDHIMAQLLVGLAESG